MHVGVVGLGHWGMNHVRVLSGARHVESLLVYDAAADRMAMTVSAARGAVAAPSAAAVFDGSDAVVIATHSSTHVEMASAALRSGCHVLVEKPLALSVDEVLEVAAVAESVDRTVMVGHTFLFHPAVRALHAAVARGDLGAVKHIESRRLNLGLYRTDCDVVWDLGPHDISILNLLLGGAPTSVRAWGAGLLSTSTTDTAQLHLEYPGGAQAVVNLSWCWPRKVRELTVVGSAGMAVFDDTDRAAPLRLYDTTVTLSADGSAPVGFIYRSGAMRVPDVPTTEPLALEDQHFIDCAMTGAAPVAGVHDALAVVQTLQAAERSLAERREVHLVEIAPTRRRSGLFAAHSGGAG